MFQDDYKTSSKLDMQRSSTGKEFHVVGPAKKMNSAKRLYVRATT